MRFTPGKGRSWYIRLTAYLIGLLVVAYLVSNLRGRIPQAFGLTPIRVHALSVRATPVNDGTGAAMTDVSVGVRVVGWDSVYSGLALSQFRLRTDEGTNHQPYASDLLFDSTGTLTIHRGDTLTGELLFLIPSDESPKQLWWEP